ncbi:hypothetical protein MLD38_036872 [Melastoma candidum]|uniref:Uncharacterized protein n=1 Tax=Melastoma candidum TaxID=119954 RepID=A0ACB9LLK0_9MYRT|nr:hypothetical protein MLD38_036872 [Melastoma candidum]
MFQPNMFDAAQHHLFAEMTSKSMDSDPLNLGRLRDEEFDTMSGAETMENPVMGEDQAVMSVDPDDPSRSKRKRYHRHTHRQIQELESFFKENPHPDEKQRKDLSRELGLEPLQVKFWFQNKRTQMKAQQERHENSLLKADNEKLRRENLRYREALATASCPSCGGPAALGEMSFDEQHLRIENARLKEEIDRISVIASKYLGKPLAHFLTNLNQAHMTARPHDLGHQTFSGQAGHMGEVYTAGFDHIGPMPMPTELDKPLIVELAVAAMEELIRMANGGEPLWVLGENSPEILNEEEYFRTFPQGISPRPLGFKTEASRESAVVVMDHINLIEILMDVNQWSSVFCGIVSRAMTVKVLSNGVVGNYDGALQVMSAEFQVPSPLVPSRKNYFVRYCKQHCDGTWVVVDVSLDSLRGTPSTRSRRRPSGCLIQELPGGYSKVIWVEHVEVDNSAVHGIYRQLVDCGLGFGAKRWVAALDRHCERITSSIAGSMPTGELLITNSEGRKGMMKLAERMVQSFSSGVGDSTARAWTMLSPTEAGPDNVRIMTRKSVDDPGRPAGIVLSAATSFWLPISRKRVFNFLRDEHSRNEWDILSNGGQVQEMAFFTNGRSPGNSLSLLRVNNTTCSQRNMLILQESCTDAVGSYVIYAPVDLSAMNIVLTGGNPDYVALLPSGFAILPDGPEIGGGCIQDKGSGGSLLTVAFQILVDTVPSAKISPGSVATVNTLIKCTVERIRASLSRDNP